MDSILKTIKEMLGPSTEDTAFDTDIIIHINSVFADLHLLGVGPKEVFSITDELETWNDFLGESKTYESVKTYVYQRVKLLFDADSLSSTAVSAMERSIERFEWGLYISSDQNNNTNSDAE